MQQSDDKVWINQNLSGTRYFQFYLSKIAVILKLIKFIETFMKVYTSMRLVIKQSLKALIHKSSRKAVIKVSAESRNASLISLNKLNTSHSLAYNVTCSFAFPCLCDLDFKSKGCWNWYESVKAHWRLPSHKVQSFPLTDSKEKATWKLPKTNGHPKIIHFLCVRQTITHREWERERKERHSPSTHIQNRTLLAFTISPLCDLKMDHGHQNPYKYVKLTKSYHHTV